MSFQSLHSVEMCLLSNTNDWYVHSDQGMWNTEYKWFLSNLGNRRKCCRVNGITSNAENITCRVLQKSCLGPLLFLFYINDLSFALKYSKVTMYADDTSIAHSA